MLELDTRPAGNPAGLATETVPPAAPGANAASPDPDQALVEAWVSRGDPLAFARLVGLHQACVFRLALSVLGPGYEADAEDVAQEVFFQVARRLHGFRGESKFRTWLHRLALNLALDRRRRSRWRKPHVDAEILERRPTANRSDDPFLSSAAAERARAVSECLATLPDSLRRVIHLRYWLGLTTDEISAVLQMPAGTVKSHLHRGRRILFHVLQAKGLSRTALCPIPGTVG